jgi:hypothetical protein
MRLVPMSAFGSYSDGPLCVPVDPKADSPPSAQFRPIYRNEYGNRRSGSFQATVTTFGTTTTGWLVDFRIWSHQAEIDTVAPYSVHVPRAKCMAYHLKTQPLQEAK